MCFSKVLRDSTFIPPILSHWVCFIFLTKICFSRKLGRIHPTLFRESHFWELLCCTSSPRCRLEAHNRFRQNCYRQANPRPHGIRCDRLSRWYLMVWENGCSSPVIFASPIDWIENEGLEQLNVKINLAVKLQKTCACWGSERTGAPTGTRFIRRPGGIPSWRQKVAHYHGSETHNSHINGWFVELQHKWISLWGLFVAPIWLCFMRFLLCGWQLCGTTTVSNDRPITAFVCSIFGCKWVLHILYVDSEVQQNKIIYRPGPTQQGWQIKLMLILLCGSREEPACSQERRPCSLQVPVVPR